LDGRADIYSLGVTLYRSAAGVLPFTGDDWYEIARQHVEERPVRPRVHNPQLSRDVERVILRCLEKDPAARYQTGEALCQALGALSLERSDTIAMRSTPSATSSETPTAPILLPGLRRRRLSRGLLAAGTALATVVALIAGAEVATRSAAHRHGATLPVAPALIVSATGAPADSLLLATTLASSDARSLDSSLASGTGGGRLAAGAARHGRRSPTAAEALSQAAAGNATPTVPASASPARERGFGSVHLLTRPESAAYVFESLEDGHFIRGRTPLPGPLSLPVGSYALVISAHYCASYRDTVHVTLNHAAPPLNVRLVCGE
jgi:serine/threonine-protein kinase